MMDFVSWDYEISNWMEKYWTCSKPPTSLQHRWGWWKPITLFPGNSFFTTSQPSNTGKDDQTLCFVLSLMQCVPDGWDSSRTTMRYPCLIGPLPVTTAGHHCWSLDKIEENENNATYQYFGLNQIFLTRVAKSQALRLRRTLKQQNKQKVTFCEQVSLHERNFVNQEEARDPNLGIGWASQLNEPSSTAWRIFFQRRGSLTYPWCIHCEIRTLSEHSSWS